MSVMQTLRNAIYGNPPSAGVKPDRAGVVKAFEEMMLAISSVATDYDAIYPTRTALNADLAHAAGSFGLVYDDGNNTGVYAKTGASGSGSWSLIYSIAQISSDLSEEIAARTATDVSLSEEIAARIAADGSLADSVSQNSAAIASEIAARTDADNSFTNEIDQLTAIVNFNREQSIAVENALSANIEQTAQNLLDEIAARIATDGSIVDRLNAWQIASEKSPIIVGNFVRYYKMIITREGVTSKVIDPSDYSLPYFELPISQSSSNAFFHYIDVALIAPAQTAVSPIKYTENALVKADSILFSRLAYTINGGVFYANFARSQLRAAPLDNALSAPSQHHFVFQNGTPLYDENNLLGGGAKAHYFPLTNGYSALTGVLCNAVSNAECTELAGYCKISSLNTGTVETISINTVTGLISVTEFDDYETYLLTTNNVSNIEPLVTMWRDNYVASTFIRRTEYGLSENQFLFGKSMDWNGQQVFADTGTARAPIVGTELLALGFTHGYKSIVNGRSAVGRIFSSPIPINTRVVFRFLVEIGADNSFGVPSLYLRSGNTVVAYIDTQWKIEKKISPRERIYRIELPISVSGIDNYYMGMAMGNATGAGAAPTGTWANVTGLQDHCGPIPAYDIRRDDYPVYSSDVVLTDDKFLIGVENIREFPRIRDQILYDDAAITMHVAFGPGDSYTELRTWLRNLARAWKTELGDGGPGWTGVGYPNTDQSSVGGNVDEEQMSVAFTGAGWSGQWMSAQGSPDCCSATTSTAGNRVTLTYAGDNPITSMKLFFLGGSAVSRYRFNGGSWTTLALSGSGAQAVAISGIPTGTGWTMDWEHVSGTGVYHGATALTGLPGIVVHDLAISGSDLYRWAGLDSGDPAAWRANQAAAIDRLGEISTFVCPIGTNDQSYSRTYDSYRIGMGAWIDQVARVSSPGCDVLWVCAPENGRDPSSVPQRMALFTEQAKTVAIEKSIALLDMQPLFGANYAEYGDTGTKRILFVNDLLHPNDAGGSTYRQAIRSALTNRS